LSSLLGRGGFGSVYAGMRLADGAPVRVPEPWHSLSSSDGIVVLPRGARAPLVIVLLAKVSTGLRGVVQLLESSEHPSCFLLVVECPERSQDLLDLILARGFLPEEEAQGLFCQVHLAVQHCTSGGVLHRDIKLGNILVDLATGQAKLIGF
ncbi:PIM1 kinase, partial [Grantiella picta]|nr:PIM1 kinase [Grantiella picta]